MSPLAFSPLSVCLLQTWDILAGVLVLLFDTWELFNRQREYFVLYIQTKCVFGLLAMQTHFIGFVSVVSLLTDVKGVHFRLWSGWLLLQAQRRTMTVNASTQRKKLILDVDTGIDDAHAIMLALSNPTVDVVAITCANGNVKVDDVAANTLRVLQVCNRMDVSCVCYKQDYCQSHACLQVQMYES